MVVLENLLRYIIGLSKLNYVLYFVFLEIYEVDYGIFYLGRLVYLYVRLKQMLQELGRFNMVWFSVNFCFYCGDRIFYDSEFISCFCYLFVQLGVYIIGFILGIWILKFRYKCIVKEYKSYSVRQFFNVSRGKENMVQRGRGY